MSASDADRLARLEQRVAELENRLVAPAGGQAQPPIGWARPAPIPPPAIGLGGVLLASSFVAARFRAPGDGRSAPDVAEGPATDPAAASDAGTA